MGIKVLASRNNLKTDHGKRNSVMELTVVRDQVDSLRWLKVQVAGDDEPFLVDAEIEHLVPDGRSIDTPPYDFGRLRHVHMEAVESFTIVVCTAVQDVVADGHPIASLQPQTLATPEKRHALQEK
jgi:hypothetical protein